PRAATDAEIARVHPMDHVERILAMVPPAGLAMVDPDTALSPGSRDAVLRAAGAVVAAVDAVVGGEAENAFCAVRPPGHHAEPVRAMGFCLFNNVAIGAAHARTVHGLNRVAVVDFDVHHGNGTQAFFFDDPDYLYCSTHQWPLYPGTGATDETGVAGNIVNAVLPPGADGEAFRDAFDGQVMPALDAFAPDFLLISAGFDAHRADPLAGLRLATEDYGWATERLREAADRHCGGRLVSALEGGYDLKALGESAAAHVRALMA
ncbi:MAG: histone deacetylase family protein, partial [Rhodospirillaceae bacterium]|nr:histone deacetylase family protein [Rhodospirillaceae bacterium]